MERSLKIQEFLFQTKRELENWLLYCMKDMDSDYWNNMVLPKLSYQQEIMIQQKNISSLDKLDLACLLRIFDKNWYDFSLKYHLNPQLRSYLKELQIIRNKYAHQTERFSDEEMNRDIDTLYLFLSGIGANHTLLKEVKSLVQKEVFIATETNNSQSEYIEQGENISEDEQNNFKPKDIIKIKANPNETGVILSLDGEEVSVFLNGEIKTFFLNQIEPKKKKEIPFIPISTVRNYLSSFIIRHPSITSLYSLNAARIDSIPYQFKPVIKIIQSDQPRLLIADGVGIGKTIEAGLILRELQIRNNIKSVLIVCPKPLITEKKWFQEMKKFDEDFETLDTQRLKYCLDEYDLEGEWPEKYQKVIMPFSICDKNLLKEFEKLNPFPKFDLVIVDEAHHLKNSESFRYKVVEKFCSTAEAIIFLTATPIQLGNEDLFVLLNLLRPDLIPDKETFSMIHQPNKYITAAIQAVRIGDFKQAKEELLNATDTSSGDLIKERPDYKTVMKLLEQKTSTIEDKVLLIDTISKMHTFSTLINRTQRKDVASDFCVRHSITVRSSFSNEEQSVFDKIISLKSCILRDLHGTSNVKFMMTTLERQASSCLQGLVPLMSGILNRGFEDVDINFSDVFTEEENIDTETIMNDIGVLDKYKKQINELIFEIKNLSSYDPKFEEFYKVIKEKQSLENKKVIVFSTFRHTLNYLKDCLECRGIRVGLIHGGINDDERDIIRSRFKKSTVETDAYDVLLFSDVGCEGLDYQFCDTMINYDLPWNPMKIEQRIGRIDRFGQQSEAVAIYNMIVDGTIDAHIYDRCLLRINIFEQSIGDCDEILGEIHSEIKSVCESITLTLEQKNEKLEKIAQNQYRNIMEQRELEEKQLELFCVPSKISVTKELERFENYWISPIALKKLVLSYLHERGGSINAISGIGPKHSLRLSMDAKQILLKDYLNLPTKKGKIFKSWERYLKGTEQTIQITFDMETARTDMNCQFIMPLHPLVISAAMFFQSEMPIKTAFKIIDNGTPIGKYPFMIYAWDYKGYTPNVKLKAICSEKNIEKNLLNLLEVGAPVERAIFEEENLKLLKEQIHNLWKNDLNDYKKQMEEWKNYKTRSLDVSTKARKNVARQRASGVSSILENWLNKIDREYQEKLINLQSICDTADILISPILSGIIEVAHEDNEVINAKV